MAEATGRYVWVKDSKTGEEKVQWVSDKVLYSYSQLEKSGITSSPFLATEQQKKEAEKNVSDEVKKSVAKDIQVETQRREQIKNLSGFGAGGSSPVALSSGASALNTIKGSGQVYFLFSPVAETQYENIKKAGLEKNINTLFENVKNLYSRDKKEDSIVYVDWDFESGTFRIERETLSGYNLPSLASGGVSSLSKEEIKQLSSQGIDIEDVKNITRTITIEQPKTAGFGSYDVGVMPKFVQKAEIEYQPKNQAVSAPSIKPLFFDEERKFLSKDNLAESENFSYSVLSPSGLPRKETILAESENFSYSVLSPSGLPRKETIFETKTTEIVPSDVIDYLSYSYGKMLASNKSIFFGERPKDEAKGFLWDIAVYGAEKPFAVELLTFTPSAFFQSVKELGEAIGIQFNLGNRPYIANLTEAEKKSSVEALKDVGLKHLWQGLEIPISIVVLEKARTTSAVLSTPVFRAVSSKLPFEISASQFFSPKVFYPTLIATQTYAETGDVQKSVAAGIGGFAVIRAFEFIPDAVIKYKQTFNKYDTARGLGEVTERIFVQSKLHSTPEEALNFMRTATAKEIQNAYKLGSEYGDYLSRTIPKYETITIQKGGRFEIPNFPEGAVAVGFEPKSNVWKAWVQNKARDIGFSFNELTPSQKTEFFQLMNQPVKPSITEYFGERISSFRQRVLELPEKWIDYVFFTDTKTGLPKTITFSSSVSAPETPRPKTAIELVKESKPLSSISPVKERVNIVPELKTTEIKIPKLEVSERLLKPVEEKTIQKQKTGSLQKAELITLQKTELIIPVKQSIKQSQKTEVKENTRQIQKTDLVSSLRQELKQSQKTELVTSLRTSLKNALRTELKTEQKTELKTGIKTLTKTIPKTEIKTEVKQTPKPPILGKELFKILEIEKGRRSKTKVSGNLLDSLTAYLKSFSKKGSPNKFL
jgi:hypothetical protein